MNYAEHFKAISCGVKTGKSANFGANTADVGSDFQHPMEGDLVPDPRDVLVPAPPNGATRHPDYDLFGRDSGGRGPARAHRAEGLPRGYGARERERLRDERRLAREAGLQQAEQAAEQDSTDLTGLTDDDFAGDVDKPGLPTWVFGLLGIAGIWGVAELLSHKLESATPHSRRLSA
jgi:hypothetical protein